MFGDHQIGDPLGVGSGISWDPPGVVAIGAATNLLLWTEAMDNAVWTKLLVTVSADVDSLTAPPGDGSATADQLTWAGGSRRLSQITSVPASSLLSGGSVAANLDGMWHRVSSTGVFDTGTYTVSVYVKYISGSGLLNLLLNVNGGFIEVRLQSIIAGLVANVGAWQLESGSSATAYVPRTT